jgi:hypothetical protein
MDTCTPESGSFFPGTIGFPIRITLCDLSANDLTDIQTIDLTITRPDGTQFTRSLLPADIIDGAVQYVTQDGDLPFAGGYRYLIILHMTGNRALPLYGRFGIRPPR